MAEIAVKVVDPVGGRSAQLLDDGERIRALIVELADRLELPRELNYRLIAVADGRQLRSKTTLRKAGIGAGAELRLEVISDKWLRMLLDELYDEAQDYLADRLWDYAEENLERILRLDPDYAGAAELHHRAMERRPWDERPIGSMSPPPLPGQPPPSPAAAAETAQPAASGSQGGGCLVLVVVVVAVAVGANWDRIVDWYEQAVERSKQQSREQVPDAVGTITATDDGLIEIVDHNQILDYAYRLYLNGRYIGDVRNPAGGTTRYDVPFATGANLIELRYLDDNGAQDTRLEIRVNHSEFTREFMSRPGDHRDFQWKLAGVRR